MLGEGVGWRRLPPPEVVGSGLRASRLEVDREEAELGIIGRRWAELCGGRPLACLGGLVCGCWSVTCLEKEKWRGSYIEVVLYGGN